jgi:hypothetical protein
METRSFASQATVCRAIYLVIRKGRSQAIVIRSEWLELGCTILDESMSFSKACALRDALNGVK